jgi:hypothetical protein
MKVEGYLIVKVEKKLGKLRYKNARWLKSKPSTLQQSEIAVRHVLHIDDEFIVPRIPEVELHVSQGEGYTVDVVGGNAELVECADTEGDPEAAP